MSYANNLLTSELKDLQRKQKELETTVKQSLYVVDECRGLIAEHQAKINDIQRSLESING